MEALKEMGVQATCKQIDSAMKALYPDGHDGIDEGVQFRDLFRHLRNQKS